MHMHRHDISLREWAGLDGPGAPPTLAGITVDGQSMPLCFAKPDTPQKWPRWKRRWGGAEPPETPRRGSMTGRGFSPFWASRGSALSGSQADERERPGKKPWVAELGKR